MTEADVTCVVCRSPDTVGPSKLYCADCEPVGHRDERVSPERAHPTSGPSTATLWIFDETRGIDISGFVGSLTWTEW